MPSVSSLVYLTCPKCETRIRTPFSRGGPPMVFVHARPKHAICRLIVQVAREGEQHVREVVPDTVSLETALLAALARWQRESSVIRGHE